MEIEADAKDETYAQEDYEELMKESAEKRAADSKTITEKESQKAGLEGDLGTAKKDKKATSTDLMALGEYVASLHGSCDFLLENFEVCGSSRGDFIFSVAASHQQVSQNLLFDFQYQIQCVAKSQTS